MSTIAGDLVTTTASTATSINCAGQSQLIADGKLDAAETGQTGDYHLEDRSRYRIQDTESIQSLWSNGAWTETGHNFTVDYEAHDAQAFNQTVNLPKNSDPIITNNPDGSTSSQIIRLGQDQSTVTSAGGYDYHLTQSGTPKDFVFSLNHTSQSQSGKHDTGTWQAADGSSGATYDNLGSETKNSRANLSGRVQNGSVYYDGIDVYQTRNTSTDNTGSGFALGSTTSSHTVGTTQTTESRGGNSGSWYGSKLESGNSTTNYTTVSGTMGQPFSGMTQTGFNTTTMYGTAAQTGITGMYGYGQTGTGGGYNTLSTSPTIAPPDPSDFPVSPGSPNYITPGFSQPSPTSEESAWWWVKPASEGYSEGAYRIFNLIFWAAPITPDDVANGIASVENHINDNVTSALDEIFEEFDAGESANISSSNFELQSIKSIKDYLKALGEPGSVRFFALGGIAIGGVGLVIASGSVALPIAIFFGFWGADQIQANAREFWEGKHQQTYGNRILGGGVLGFAYDAVPQLFFGRFIPKTGPVNAGGIVAPRPVPSLPKYDGGKTSGVLRFGESDVPLLSGYKGPSASMPKGTPGMNGNIKSHVEAHASAIMREQGLSEATLYINRIPCPGKTGCDAMLPRMLPEGARLRVIGPNGFERIYVGLPD